MICDVFIACRIKPHSKVMQFLYGFLEPWTTYSKIFKKNLKFNFLLFSLQCYIKHCIIWSLIIDCVTICFFSHCRVVLVTPRKRVLRPTKMPPPPLGMGRTVCLKACLMRAGGSNVEGRYDPVCPLYAVQTRPWRNHLVSWHCLCSSHFPPSFRSEKKKKIVPTWFL